MDLPDILPGPSEENQGLVDQDLRQWLPPIKSKTQAPLRFAQLPENRRQRRCALYARTQKSYKRNRARCGDEVLSGAWEAKAAGVPLEAQDAFWRPLFETPTVCDSCSFAPIRELKFDSLRPFSNLEVSSSLKSMSASTAPGPDGRAIKSIRALPIDHIVSRLNLWLLTGCLPSELCEGYTSLIPKEPGTDDPAKHCPTTVSLVLTHLFHKLLAKRLDVLCPPGVKRSDQEMASR